jgi:sialate O-acetylesterase
MCAPNGTDWVAAPASTIPGEPLTIALTVPSSCIGKVIDGLRYLWRETPCAFKQAAIYSTLDSNLPAPPYIKYF